MSVNVEVRIPKLVTAPGNGPAPAGRRAAAAPTPLSPKHAAARLMDEVNRYSEALQALLAGRESAYRSIAETVQAGEADAARAAEAAEAEIKAQETALQAAGEALVRFSRRWANQARSNAAAAVEASEVIRAGLDHFDRQVAGLEKSGAARVEAAMSASATSAAVLRGVERGARVVARELTRLETHVEQQVELHRAAVEQQRRVDAARENASGCRALHAGSLAEAERHFRKALEVHGSAARFNLVLVLALQGRVAEAAQELSSPDLSECDPVELQALRSLLALQQRDYPRALREAEAALQIRPGHGVLRWLAATAALGGRSATDALKHVSQAQGVPNKGVPGLWAPGLLDELASSVAQPADAPGAG